MLKARGQRNGREIVVFGLSYGNLDRLREGLPIQFDGTTYGFAGDVIIFAGPDEQAMARMIGVDERTTVHEEPGAP